ncbi:phosphoribosylformylglycinamidine synthase-associated small membrane protein [Chthonobacter albigriseus]|nr:phosphoribosylformylglycinamidine synthase-associated small membrane protein [Chthonobacter albigriseus]
MPGPEDDTARIVRFMIVKAAVFIGIPLVAALLAVLFLMP